MKFIFLSLVQLLLPLSFLQAQVSSTLAATCANTPALNTQCSQEALFEAITHAVRTIEPDLQEIGTRPENRYNLCDMRIVEQSSAGIMYSIHLQNPQDLNDDHELRIALSKPNQEGHACQVTGLLD